MKCKNQKKTEEAANGEEESKKIDFEHCSLLLTCNIKPSTEATPPQPAKSNAGGDPETRSDETLVLAIDQTIIDIEKDILDAEVKIINNDL